MAKVFTITEGLENMGALKTGGQGSVYKGRRIGPVVTAVKLLPTPIHTEDPNDKNFIDFQNEVHKLKKVNEQPNPNVVKIMNSGITETGSFPFIEMEFIEGPDLEELLKPPHEQIFTIKEAIKLAEQLSNALAHCHNVDVKHGDVKSNNVKFNQHTGNYVLLDFGLAVMSDEQRRTSLRRAGAIEFMAPEQSEGLLLFQSDVYSFGIILFELLAGVVPFPLHDKGESARNQVMLAHLETPPPDLRELRKKHLPESWGDVKKTREMQVPEWMVSMVYRCLRKKPEERFANGKELHDYIVLNSTIANNSTSWNAEQLNVLRQQNEQLQREKEQLQQTVLKYQQESKASAQELQKLRSENDVYLQNASSGRRRSTGMVIAIIVAILSLAGFIYVLANRAPVTTGKTDQNDKPVEQKKAVLAKYRVQSPKAFFHTLPDESTKRGAYLYANDPINAYADTTDFVYTEFTNSRGQTSKGWLRKIDLLTEDEWNQQKAERQSRAMEEQHKNQLRQAQQYLDEFQYDAALAIYKQLLDKDIPEATYHYADMMLQNRHNEIDCATAWSMLETAADKGWIPAKTTMGYLLMFAENRAVLNMNNYGRCEYKRDLTKALTLLNEAAAKGDDTAKGILEQFHLSNQE